jgi:hypothetical protein
MSQIKLHLQSFNSGELSETMASRFGVEKVATGCRQLRNMLPHVHGPAEKRPGMQWLGAAHNPAIAPRLLEFNFSATTRFIIEFGVGVFRIWNVATAALQTTLATVAHPYAQAEWWEVQARQVNDVVYLTHPNHHPRRLTRRANNDWVCELMPLTYPPLLDDYVVPEPVAPTITTLLEAPLEMAPEWTLPARPEDPIPFFESDPSGVADAPWFELEYTTWGSEFPSIAGGVNPTLNLQVVNSADEWVNAGAVTISLTSTPAFKMQYAFQPAATTTSVLIRRRTWNGSSWGSWSTITTVVLTLPSGSTAATMPTLTFRLVIGPENIAGSNAHRITVTPITTARGSLFDPSLIDPGVLRLSVRQQLPVSYDFSRTWNLPGSFPAQQQARWQVFTGTSWATVQQQIIAVGLSDSQSCRLRRSGGNLIFERIGTGGVYAQLGSIACAIDTDWQMRLFVPVTSINGTVSFIGGNTGRFEGASPDLDEFTVPLSRTFSGTGADAGTGGVTVPAGKWQFRAEVFNEAEVPAGARIRLQRRTSGTWANILTWDVLDGGGVFEYDGSRPATEFAANTLVRVLYESTTGVRVAGVAQIERVTLAAAAEITLKCNAVNGNNRTLTASAALFQAGHVGSFWQIAHRRDRSFVQLVGVVGVFPASKRESKAIRIVGAWDFFSYGTWRGDVHLERRPLGGAWSIVRTWSGNKDRNIIANGVVDSDAEYRIRLASGFRGFAASGADVPRFVLEAADSRTYGLVRVTGFTSATQVTVDIVRPLESRDATASWAEGAWSGVRGYPAAVGIHEGRLWFGGSTHQPSGLWASVSNDFENFRRGTTDDASIMVSLAAETGSQIQWLSSSDDALMIGTGGEEWTIRSNFEGQPITPSNIKAGRRGAYSSARLPARVTQDSALFVQRNERKIRQANYSSTDGQFTASDMTVLSPHLFLSGIKQMALTQSPWNVAWVVLGNGKLAAMTFEREQNVFAWSLHETAGNVRSVAVAVGVTSDQVWLSVERNGVASIERLDPAAVEREVSNWKRLIYCDAAVVRTGPATTFTAAHLANRQVVGLADGVAFVATANGSGQITFPASKTDVVMGLAYEAKIQPMKIELPMRDGTSQARRVKVARVGAEVIESFLGPKVADGDDGVFDSLPIETPSPAGPWSGMAETAIEGRTDDAVNVVVKDSTPFPFMLGGLVLKLDVYGD